MTESIWIKRNNLAGKNQKNGEEVSISKRKTARGASVLAGTVQDLYSFNLKIRASAFGYFPAEALATTFTNGLPSRRASRLLSNSIHILCLVSGKEKSPEI